MTRYNDVVAKRAATGVSRSHTMNIIRWYIFSEMCGSLEMYNYIHMHITTSYSLNLPPNLLFNECAMYCTYMKYSRFVSALQADVSYIVLLWNARILRMHRNDIHIHITISLLYSLPLNKYICM